MSPRGLLSSSAFHAVILLLLVFGLPSFLQPEPIPEPQVISVELLPISEIANAPTKMPTPPKKQEEPPKPLPPKPEPEKPKPEPKKEEPKPEEKKPESKPEPVKEAIPDPTKKEEPKKEEPKKEEPKKEEPTLDDILKSLDKEKPKTPPAPQTPQETASPDKGEKTISDRWDPTMQVSQTVKDSIRNQITKCWNYQGGAKDQDKMSRARIMVQLNQDGSVANALLHGSQQGEYRSNPHFRALVDSAIRATRNPTCVPLKGLPADKYQGWKEMELVFDPSQMF